MTTRQTPETDALSSDPTIERHSNVPPRVWRAMAELERQRDEAVELLREILKVWSGYMPSATHEIARAFLAKLDKERKL